MLHREKSNKLWSYEKEEIYVLQSGWLLWFFCLYIELWIVVLSLIWSVGREKKFISTCRSNRYILNEYFSQYCKGAKIKQTKTPLKWKNKSISSSVNAFTITLRPQLQIFLPARAPDGCTLVRTKAYHLWSICKQEDAGWVISSS